MELASSSCYSLCCMNLALTSAVCLSSSRIFFLSLNMVGFVPVFVVERKNGLFNDRASQSIIVRGFSK